MTVPPLGVPNQIEFVDLIIDSFVEEGVVNPELFYERPFTDFDAMGLAGLFPAEQANEILAIVQRANKAAEVAA